MTTFYDPAKIRELADAGDPFWKGAAWVLDQQAAARIDTTDYDSADAWVRTPAPMRGMTDQSRKTIARLRAENA